MPSRVRKEVSDEPLISGKGESMKIFTPLRVVTFVAALFAALSLGLGVAFATSSHAGDERGVGVFNGDQGSRACVHTKKLLERNERNVINYYTIAFNDKNRDRDSRGEIVSRADSWNPRLAFRFDPKGDGCFDVHGGYARYADKLHDNIADAEHELSECGLNNTCRLLKCNEVEA